MIANANVYTRYNIHYCQHSAYVTNTPMDVTVEFIENTTATGYFLVLPAPL